MMVPCQVHDVMVMNQGGTADNRFYSSLTEDRILLGAFLFV